MAKASSAKPSLVPAFLALLVLILFGYLLYSDSQPTRTEHTVSPPIEIITLNDQPPLTIINETEQAPSGEQVLKQEAKLFVEQLSPKIDKSVVINPNNDLFVRHNSIITLPDLEHRITTLQSLMADKSLAGDTAITLNYTSETPYQTTLAKLSEDIEDHNEIITIITENGDQITASLADLLNQSNVAPDASITHLLKKKHRVQTHFSELAKLDIKSSQHIIADILHGTQDIALNDILPADIQSDDALFYLHRVTDRDVQGLWGIIQSGLIDKFRQGLNLEGISQNKDLIQTVIPSDADEKLSSGLSSFLGKILNNKVDSSYIYNLETRTMGFDANVIHPGQQLILIHFSPSELKQIYQFFSEKRNQDTETFAITD
ncbi:MAG: hypothetical protein GQ548_01325 [Methylophaga sp.]|nr:hypothetical protein [Methylophaga sp.]